MSVQVSVYIFALCVIRALESTTFNILSNLNLLFKAFYSLGGFSKAAIKGGFLIKLDNAWSTAFISLKLVCVINDFKMQIYLQHLVYKHFMVIILQN